MINNHLLTRFDNYVYPLSRVEPPADGTMVEDALTVLDDIVADAVVVGLGEATHGTRECHTLRHRALRRLVAKHGFRTVSLEACPGQGRILDRYVREGEGTAGEKLSDSNRWMYHADSLRALVEWLRAFNSDRPAADKVRVYGVEPGDARPPARHLREFFESVDPAYADASDGLELLVDQRLEEYDDEETAERIELALGAVDELETRLDDQSERYVEAGSREAYEIARYLADCIGQAYTYHRLRRDHWATDEDGGVHPTEESHAERERMTATNVAWCAEHDPGEGTVHLAHDAHVQRGTDDSQYEWSNARTRGSQLAERFGDQYRVVGFEVGRGALKAIDLADEANPLRIVEIDEPLDDSLAATLDAVVDGAALLDVRGASGDDRLGEWFDEPRRKRSIGAVFDETAPPERYYLDTDIPQSFDALFFVPDSTPTTRIEV